MNCNLIGNDKEGLLKLNQQLTFEEVLGEMSRSGSSWKSFCINMPTKILGGMVPLIRCWESEEPDYSLVADEVVSSLWHFPKHEFKILFGAHPSKNLEKAMQELSTSRRLRRVGCSVCFTMNRKLHQIAGSLESTSFAKEAFELRWRFVEFVRVRYSVLFKGAGTLGGPWFFENPEEEL